MAQDAGAVLAGLSSAGTPWLALAMGGPAAQGRLVRVAGPATVIDIADPATVPVTVNPLQPGPGYPVQAHADRLAALFEVAFGLEDPVAAALRAGLRRAYADCGWDLLTGAAGPGAVSSPAVPSFRQLKLAVLAAAGDLGYGVSMRASVRGFLVARLDALWAGPAGHFLEGGHPVDLARLPHGNVLVANSGVADDAASTFLGGVLLLRLAEQLSHGPADPPGRGANASQAPGRRPDGEGPRLAIVIASASADRPGFPPRTAAWLSGLRAEVRLAGADIIAAPLAGGQRPGPPRAPGSAPGVAAASSVTPVARASSVTPVAMASSVTPGPVASPSGAASAVASPSGAAVAVSALLSGRRSAACGERCRRRPCDGLEMHAAALLAGDHGQAWLRLWVRTLVLAFLTGRPAPRVPAPLRPGWQVLSPRRGECLLATVVDAAVTVRAAALRPYYDPRCLIAVIAAVTGRTLTTGDAGPSRAGPVWVIPQLRWLHEMERVNPLGQDRPRPDDIAPPLDFGLAGLPDWPGIRVADRLGGLRRHRLAMESERNRRAASIALLGGDGRADLDADLAIAGMGISPPLRLRHAAQMMGAGGHEHQPGWLEVVLSWPHRIIRPSPAPDQIASGPDEH